MAGETEEPFRFNFQADLLHSGSISFGRFESESLSWEKRSSFLHNRYLEEVEKYSKPGSVTEKKAYFEAHFRRKALLKQSSSECQDGKEFQTSENDDPQDLQEPENGKQSKYFTYDEEIDIQKCEKEKIEIIWPDNDNTSSHVTSPASEMKQTESKQNMQANEASNGSANAKTRKSEGLLMKEKQKMPPRPVSPITHSRRKTSKLEESSMSNPKARLVPPKKSIVKEYRSEKTAEAKSLSEARQTTNRIKQTIKPQVNQAVGKSAAGFTFKCDQRAERRKEEKKAAEMTQSRKSLNLKSTPMPSFYKESGHSSGENKVISTSKTPNRPRTPCMSTRTNRFSSNSTPSPSDTISSSSSISLTNRNRPLGKSYVPERRLQEKKKELSSHKQKAPEPTKGPRVRDTLRKDAKGVEIGQKMRYLAVSVAI